MGGRLNVAINGFGRIGRMFYKRAIAAGLKVVAINDLMDDETMHHLLKYDSVHGRYGNGAVIENGVLRNGTTETRLMHETSPGQLPWAMLAVDLVVECTGKFLTAETAAAHLQAGAQKVILSAPPKDTAIPMYVCGVSNDAVLDNPIISNASCTTNNAAMLLQVLEQHWGVKEGYITTVHSNTGDQNLHDAPHNDLRRARAASASIIPTTTGAAKAVTAVFPHLQGKLGGAGIRVPVLNGSLTDITCLLNSKADVAEINTAFEQAAKGPLAGLLEYTADPIVSIDIIGNTHSCVFDSQLTSVVGDMVRVVGWYDNEAGYSERLVDVIKLMEKNG